MLEENRKNENQKKKNRKKTNKKENQKQENIKKMMKEDKKVDCSNDRIEGKSLGESTTKESAEIKGMLQKHKKKNRKTNKNDKKKRNLKN